MTEQTIMLPLGRKWTVLYTDWRGETGVRHIDVIYIRFGSSNFHDEPQWLVRALDLDKDTEWEFALKDMRPIPTPPVAEAA